MNHESMHHVPLAEAPPRQAPLEFPPGYALEGRGTLVKSEDCMGQPFAHATRAARTPHQSQPLIVGHGADFDAAEADLVRRCWDDYNTRRLSDRDRLAKIIQEAGRRGSFPDKDLVQALEIIARRIF